MLNVLLIGVGAIGNEVLRHLASDPDVKVVCALDRSMEVGAEALRHACGIKVVRSAGEIQELPDFAIECSGADAIREHVIPLLRRGVDVGICSVGALVDDELAADMEGAARAGKSQVQILAGAVGGIDALASAKLLGLDTVTLISRKPPVAWLGTPAEKACNLHEVGEPVIVFHGSARRAAALYPKNANAAATVALAGIGLDRTEVKLVADPTITTNIHEIDAHGAFGDMRFFTSNKALPENPKTSALAVLSAIRAIRNYAAAVAI